MTSSDHTSAALYNLIREAMRDGRIAGPELSAAHGEARVAHADKSQLLESVLEHEGATGILSLGHRVVTAPTDSLIKILIRPHSVEETVQRWQRLEKVYHSRHRVVVSDIRDDRLRLRHVATRGPAPDSLDDLLIAGIMIGLIEAVGRREVVASFVGGGRFYENATFELREFDRGADYSAWEIDWLAADVVVEPSLESVDRDDVALGTRLKTLFDTDPARSWTLAMLGVGCGLSTRTLQRRLAAEGTSVQKLLREFRAASAAHMLAHSDADAARIAFACGYSDQAHLAREFKRCTGMRPTSFRRALR